MRYFLLNDMRYLDKTRYPLMVERFIALGLEPHEILPIEYLLAWNYSFHLRLWRILKPSSTYSCDTTILVLCPGAEFGQPSNGQKIIMRILLM